MNAERHYREAERLVELAESVDWQDGDPDRPNRAEYAQTALAEAQVHATLALVGATLMERSAPYSDDNAGLYSAAVVGR